jgi:dihydrofolate synthase/folylpolyglutamate synthase
MQENILAEKAQAFNLTGKHYKDVHEALADAMLHSVKEDLILVCGSVFLIGEVEPGKIKGL